MKPRSPLTNQEIEEGLNHQDGYRRHLFALKAEKGEFEMGAMQLQRGLGDDDLSVRMVYERNQLEWQAKAEALMLKNRHIKATQPKHERVAAL